MYLHELVNLINSYLLQLLSSQLGLRCLELKCFSKTLVLRELLLFHNNSITLMLQVLI